MNFEPSHLYHIYNQGNNRQKIFFNRANYLFFLKKIRIYILPYADVLAWCLMPNHFHMMVQYNNSHNTRTFNNSIGIMLRSYTCAVNNQQRRTGSLFRQETKAICLTSIDHITPAWFYKMGITRINISLPEKQYPNECFNYIVFNPVKDGLVKKIQDWEFSSFSDYISQKNSPIINNDLINKLGLVLDWNSQDDPIPVTWNKKSKQSETLSYC